MKEFLIIAVCVLIGLAIAGCTMGPAHAADTPPADASKETAKTPEGFNVLTPEEEAPAGPRRFPHGNRVREMRCAPRPRFRG